MYEGGLSLLLIAAVVEVEVEVEVVKLEPTDLFGHDAME